MNTKITRERILKYPQKEIAVAFIGQGEHPFKKAMIGVCISFCHWIICPAVISLII